MYGNAGLVDFEPFLKFAILTHRSARSATRHPGAIIASDIVRASPL